MAIESPNFFVAAAQINGIDGFLSVIGSRGVIESTFTRTGPGRYTIQLTDPVATAALVCQVNAAELNDAPLIAFARPDLVAGETLIRIFTDDNAGVATDGLLMLAVLRPETEA